MKFNKTLGTVVMALGIGLVGCKKEVQEQEPQQEIPKQEETYSFDKFVDLRSGYWDITRIRTADLDGDGDLDIIVGNTNGSVIIYENRIKQKKDYPAEASDNNQLPE